MYYNKLYFLMIIASVIITGCQKLVTDPGTKTEELKSDQGLNYWGGTYNDEGYSVIQTADGGYAIAGSQYTSTDQQEDLILAKFSSSLAFEDTISIGTSAARNFANDIQQTRDGGYVIIGNTFNGIDDDVWIVKLAPDLSVTWQDTIKTVDGSDDWGNSIQQMNSGAYVICGTSYDATNDDYDIMVWTLSYSGTENYSGTPTIVFADVVASVTNANTNDFGNYAHQTEDGGFIIIGTVNSDIGLVKLISDGDGTYSPDPGFNAATTPGYLAIDVGTASIDEGKFVQQKSDGNYIVVGNTEAGIGQQSDVYVTTVTSAGSESATTLTIGGAYDDKVSCVRQTSDGGYVFTGEMYNGIDSNSEYDVWAVKLTDALTVHWNYTYGYDKNDHGSSIAQTDDGGYIITGSTMSYDNQSEIVLLKLNSDGQISDIIGNLNKATGN